MKNRSYLTKSQRDSLGHGCQLFFTISCSRMDSVADIKLKLVRDVLEPIPVKYVAILQVGF